MGTQIAETSFVRGLLPNAILAVTLTGAIWTPLCLAQTAGFVIGNRRRAEG